MADLDKLMENFAERAEKLVVPDQAKRKAMTAAGAEVLTKALKEETRDKHYRIRKIGKVKHLADSVTFQNTDVNGEDNGNSVVGFQGKESGINHARIARFLNDGTKYITGDSFVDNTRRDQAAKVLAAEKAVYDSGGEGRGSTD
ncbi:HK97 gp10 family phage protein [Limosilactobacillus difficilis]|uniref:HK97 gp10 family phage protein n=1 Tax=Limosilactobacillus difficilis TaxID=2991838 RepID=UPI0024BB38EA|nr:HK97 gp10 family phage protein [Limosilactobacillus difficilis]